MRCNRCATVTSHDKEGTNRIKPQKRIQRRLVAKDTDEETFSNLRETSSRSQAPERHKTADTKRVVFDREWTQWTTFVRSTHDAFVSEHRLRKK
mmetsp:Transcript_32799/g.60420  ORF Transcript_32799/g.60420 Transcript_32799/m.60420 type:complete len:94 (-) Transcript_32799:23-304(-)